jgi:hypothetical protein
MNLNVKVLSFKRALACQQPAHVWRARQCEPAGGNAPGPEEERQKHREWTGHQPRW